MFTIIQSHRTEHLVAQLLGAYQSQNLAIFDEFIVIVPSMVLGDWLDKSIASQAGISTLVTTIFWGQYQWTLMQQVLAEYNSWLESEQRTLESISVPEVAVLNGAVMQWRLFGYFTYYQSDIMANDSHPLYPLLSALLDEEADSSQKDARLWSLATDFSRVFSRYLSHREEWLTLWSGNQAVNVAEMIAAKDALTLKFDKYAGMTPEWLVAHYTELEAAQRHLWHVLFAAVYEHRAAIETRFWALMSGKIKPVGCDVLALLPRQLHIFTIQQLPQNELNFLQRLSQYIDITLLHYNPSQLFWADIVDKQWLQRQRVINPESVFFQDYGHTLLSRLGKQSRETFAMLASLSGNEQTENFQLNWQDKFDEVDATFSSANSRSSISSPVNAPISLLTHLQQDILMLDESATQRTTAGRVSAALRAAMSTPIDSLSKKENESYHGQSQDQWAEDNLTQKRYEQSRQWRLSEYDNSLSIHSCHNLQRQLEVLRGMIGRWLNDKNANGSTRHLSDIVVLLPDVERHNDLISSIFVNGEGQDGLNLPAKVTGVVDKSIRQLWEAISGFYRLLGSDSARFESAEVLDWLMLPPLYESLGLTHEQMSRGCDLLITAGFVRGFDEVHLQQTLDAQDYDYRFSFAYALDQIALGLVMPEAVISDCLYPSQWREGALAEQTIPIAAIALSDAPIIEALCRVHAGLNTCRYEYQVRHKAEDWLSHIENKIIHPFFGMLDQTRPMNAIFKAMNGFKSSLRANRHYQQYHTSSSSAIAPSSHSTAHQIEAKLSQVSHLPLKLSFMLGSIADELESQQVSAEPTGVITFGRFGALRNVPFGLVVMLNMDLAEFPNRDHDNRYDLMKAGLAKRGDRFSEDDDNGAFLDALLCARSACWIFYNGQRLTDTHEHLPANPVSELLQFLQGEVQWQWSPLQNEQQKLDDDSGTALTAQVQRYLPKFIEEWLVTRHPALPFAEEVFIESDSKAMPLFIQADNAPHPNYHQNPSQNHSHEQVQTLMQSLARAMQREKMNQQRTNAPAKVWQKVFECLQAQDNAPPLIKVNLPTCADYLDIACRIQAQNDNDNNDAADNSDAQNQLEITHVDMHYLYLQVRHPAKHFLRAQQIHTVVPAEDTLYQEPLSLTSLSRYTVNSALLSEIQHSSHTAATDKEVAPPQPDQSFNGLLYNPVMPAGVARQSTLTYQQSQIGEQCRSFAKQLASLGIAVDHHFESLFVESSHDNSHDNNDAPKDNEPQNKTQGGLSLLTPYAEKMVSVLAADMNAQAKITIKGLVPLEDTVSDDKTATGSSLWLNVLPYSARTQHLLRFWLMHVYWQVARHTTEQQVAVGDGRSIWRFNKGGSEKTKFEKQQTFLLAPIAYETALAELLKWVRFAQLAGHTPMAVLPVYALTYLHKVDEAQAKGVLYQPKRGDFDSWLHVTYGADTIYDTCSQHELWRYILQNQNAFTALSDALPILAAPLFRAMNDALTVITE